MPVSSETLGPSLRVAMAPDAERIARLHAKSWRSAYRTLFADAYLDGPIDDERRAFWQNRYDHPPPGLWTVVAESGAGELLGFLCLLADHDRDWGTLIDNLHADPDRKGLGLGRIMMRAAAQYLLHALPRRPVHLTVLEGNSPAIAFYDRLGGRTAGRLVEGMPDGSHLPILRYLWDDPAALAEGAQ